MTRHPVGRERCADRYVEPSETRACRETAEDRRSWTREWPTNSSVPHRSFDEEEPHMDFRFRALPIAAAVLAALVGGARAADAECVRHIYNQSSQFWKFHFTYAGSGGQDSGAGDFIGCRGAGDYQCDVPPGATVTIRFWGRTPASGMSITDAHGTERTFDYDGNAIDRILQGECQKIDHDGGTGAVSMNEPDNGDFSIGDDFW
jgi:hypothetical protein